MNFIRLLPFIKRPAVCKIISVNYGSQHPLKFLETQNMWRDNDNVSKRYQLIYKAPMENTLKFATSYLTFSTTTIGFLGVYYAAFVLDSTKLDNPVILGEDVVIANSAMECVTYLGAFVAFHIAVKNLLSKYVIRLYQDGDDYIAVFRGHWYNSIRKHEFKLKDVKKLRPTFVVSWGDARFGLGSKHAILLENYFKTPEYFNNFYAKEYEGPSQN